MREGASVKARRYLGEGRLVIEAVSSRSVRATCRGDGEVYRLGWDRSAGWTCTCLARSRCAHLLAIGLVVAVDIDSGAAG